MIIGICGGSGSGKTTVARKILEAVSEENVAYLQHDSFYKDWSHISFEERQKLNFDHPTSFDTELLIRQLRQLRAGRPVQQPVYDFTRHVRAKTTKPIAPKPIILIEGILILENAGLRSLMDLKIFVETSGDLRFIRRLQRDIAQRGRTVESVIEQYLSQVRPMHLEFVEPYKRYADIIIPEGGSNLVGIDLIIQKIKTQLAEIKAMTSRGGIAAT